MFSNNISYKSTEVLIMIAKLWLLDNVHMCNSSILNTDSMQNFIMVE